MNQLLTRASRMVAILLIFSYSAYPQSNYALDFDGTGNYVSSSAYVVPTSGDFTVEFWVYPTTYSGYREFVSQGSSGAAFYIGTTAGTGVIRCGDNWGVTGVTMPLNRWVHIALVKSGSSATLYLDGIQKASLASGYAISSAGTNFQIGTQYGGLGEYFNGKMDEVRVWDVARTQAQIKANMFNKNLDNSTAGLISYYRFNEGSGTTAANSCTNTSGIDGVLANGTAWTASSIQFAPNALNFNGTSNYVELENRINVGSSDFTIEAWVYPTSTAAGMVFAQDVCGNAEHQFRLYTNSSKVNFDMSDAASLGASYNFQLPSAANSVPLNTWTHVAAVRSANNYYIYINGVLNASSSTGTNTINNQSGADGNKRLRIGARGGVSGGCGLNYFTGSIDEVRFWNVARTSTEIQQNYATEIDPSANGNLIAYYTFNCGMAGGINAGLTTLTDQKGNNNGTLTSFSLSGSSGNFVTQNSSVAILPLKWLSFTVQKQNDGVLLRWSTASAINTSSFTIEHSTHKNNWKSIGKLSSTGGGRNYYSYLHTFPSSGLNYYRILQKDGDGRFSYSGVRSVRMDEEAASFKLITNPISNKVLQLQINSGAVQTVSLISSEGKLIWSKALSTGVHAISLDRLAKGIYFLKSDHHTETLVVH